MSIEPMDRLPDPMPSANEAIASKAASGMALRIGSGAVIATVCSLLICYSGVVGSIVFGAEDLVFNPHFQAVLMWSLALLALWFLHRDRRQHENWFPLILGTVAVITLIGTLYLGYNPQIEAAAYVLLVMAAFLNENLLLSAANTTVRRQREEIADLNAKLSQKVASQESQIDRLGRLRHFLPPQIAELVLGDDRQDLLRSHRRYIACLFCDLRNFTAMSEVAEPEEVIAVLERFHDRAGARVAERGGTIGFRAGDGLMVFFNDPVETVDPVLDAVHTAWEIRDSFAGIREQLQDLGHDVGIGIGIASGFATMGLIGLHGRTDYTAVGRVVNAAARLCDAAEDNQILMSQRASLDVERKIQVKTLPAIELKGFSRPMEIVQVQSVGDRF